MSDEAWDAISEDALAKLSEEVNDQIMDIVEVFADQISGDFADRGVTVTVEG
jgi:hypothetical protein